MIERMWLAVLFGLLGLCYGLQCPKQKTSPGREVVCYTYVSDVDQLTDAVCKCTTLVQQGYDVRNLSISEFETFRNALKKINPPLQYIVSVDDPEMALRTSGTVRQELTARLIGISKGVDGIELNMTAGSKERLVHFVKGLKDEMVRKSYDTRILMALPTKPEELAKQFDLKELSKYVDLFTISTHYLVEDDEAYHTFHPSRLIGLFDMYNADSLTDLISGLGVPKGKILVSLPSSAYKFTLKDQDDNAPRSPTEEMQPVVIDQKQLCDLMKDGEWTVERDEDLTAPYAFKNRTWIAFEDKISAGIKGKYALLRELPGLGIRNIEHDSKTECGMPLTYEVHHSFTDFKRKSRAAVLDALEDDLHQTQLSYSTKVKSSDFRVVRVVDTEGHIRAVRENTQTEFTCSRQGYFVHPKSCNRFYRCVKFNQEIEDYSVFEFDCPAGLAFDETTEVCVWPGSLSQGSPCPGSSEIAPVARVRFQCPSTPGYYADPQNPRWFFACIDLGGPHMMAYEFRCPFGLIFDEHKLICEWPWLVSGYSDSGYTRTEYDSRGYGTASTPATGGYYTGALPHGSSVTGFQGGSSHGYAGTTEYQGRIRPGSSVVGSTGTISGGSGYSGAAGVGYTTSGGYIGSGYSGSVGGSHGESEQGSTHYSGSIGDGYAGSTAGSQGATGHRYSGSATGSYGGATAKPGATGNVYGGSSGSEYAGSINTGNYGSTTGSAAGTRYTGSGINAWSGATGTGQTSIASDGNVYSGSTATGHVQTGTVYTGNTYSGGTSSSIAPDHQYLGPGSKYPGSATGVYVGSTNDVHGISASGGYQGSTGGAHDGYGKTYTGSAAGGYQGSTVDGYGKTYTGSSAGGYQGSTGGAHDGYGKTYTGSAAGGYQGSTGGVDVGYGKTYTGSTAGGYQGSTGGAHDGYGKTYTGSAAGGYQGSTGGVYDVHGKTYTGSAAGGYQGSTGGVDVGYGKTYTGSTAGGYQGSTGGADDGYGKTYTGSAAGGYQGSTGGVYDVHGKTYTESAAGGYQGSTGGAHDGYGKTYTGSAAGGYQGSTGGVDVEYGKTYTGSTAGGYQGSTGGAHDGYGKSYTGSVIGGYQGTADGVHGGAGINYVGSTSQGTVTEEYSGTGVKGSSSPGLPGVQYSGPSYGSTFSGFSAGVDYSASSTATGQAGTKYSGYDIGSQGGSLVPGQAFVTKPSQTTIYVSNTGGDRTQYTGVTGTQKQIPVSTYVQKPDGPGYNCVTCTESTPSGGVQTYLTNGYVANHGVTGSGGTVYQGTSGYTGSLNTTLIGSHVPSVGSTTFHGTVIPIEGYKGSGEAGSGTIVTGYNAQGSIVTGGAAPGTFVTYGDTSGTVLSGSSEQGTTVIGGSYPGYIQTSAGTPEYVVNQGVKTVYSGSTSPKTVVYGSHSPGVSLTGTSETGTIVKGQTSPTILVTGQTAPEASLGGSIGQGRGTGHQVYTQTGYTTQLGGAGSGSSYRTKGGSGGFTSDTGYKTNEYHDNGGRSTIRFNNGDVTTKYTENDIPDYRPAGGTIIPDTLFSGGVTGVSQASTPSIFTKTGITTATVGRQSRPTARPENIGEKAFEGNVAGYTKSSTESTVKAYSDADSTPYQGTGHVDVSKITLGPSKSTGYSYPRPNIPFETGVTPSSVGSVSPTESTRLTATTPTPFLNVEVYNAPKFGSSTPIIGSPEVVNTYQKPTGFAHVTSTVTPLYTIGPLENYKTTVFQAAKLPVATSVQPVLDTGYKTIVSSTSIPVTITQDKFDGSVNAQTGTKTSQQTRYENKDYISGTFEGPSTAQPQINYGSSGTAYVDSGFKNAFEQQNVTPFSTSGSLKPQTQYLPSSTISPAIGVTYRKPFTLSNVTPTSSIGYTSSSFDSHSNSVSGINRDGSPTNVEVPRDEVGKSITNYNRGSTKYIPNQYDVYSSGSFSGGSSSSTFQQTHGSIPSSVERTQSPFPVTTYSGGYSRPTSTISYQSTAKSTAVSKGKVIVKWSDLHPLLLSKLGAECTCRGDPFANLRGPVSKLINSSKGNVDLSNYDESEIYVDLEKDASYERNDYDGNYESSSAGPIKIWNNEARAQIQEKPSSTYLPSVTRSVNVGVRSSAVESAQSLLSGSFKHGLTANHRSGKSLSNVASTFNVAVNRDKSFNERHESGSFGSSEEIIDGVTNCARPGLFRHPNSCNKFYACHWDEWKKKFTLHVFNCPVHLSFDNGANACNWPSMGPACQDNNLLV